jgi:hypothetical protein
VQILYSCPCIVKFSSLFGMHASVHIQVCDNERMQEKGRWQWQHSDLTREVSCAKKKVDERGKGNGNARL